VVNGAKDDAMLVVNATSANSGSYQATTGGVAGPVVPFVNATSFTFNGTPESQEGLDVDGPNGHDSMTVNNPSGGLFAPANGVFFNGVAPADADTLQVLGGAAQSQTFDLLPNSGSGGHNGDFTLANGSTTVKYTFSGISPLLVNTGTPNAIAFNLPNNGMDNKPMLQDNGAPNDGLSEITSQANGFETTTFANPANSLTVNVVGPTGQTLTAGTMDAGFKAPIFYNGGTGADTLVLPPGGQAVGTVPGALFLANGGREIGYSGVETLSIPNPAAVQSLGGPNTTARTTAFIGLTPQQRFVQALYLDELGRAGAQSELNAWAAMFDVASMTQAQAQAAIARGIDTSAEARDHLVKGWYPAYLGRNAVGGEEQGFVNALLSGQTEEQVLSQLLASTEFFNRAQTLIGSGTPNERYVQALYMLLLNRAGEASGVAGWVSALPTLGRQGVALDFLTGASGTEFRTAQFEGYYDALLFRPSSPNDVDPHGLSGWVFSNMDMTSVRVSFDSSVEFFGNG
jgi:hypothetical protein